MTTQNIRRAATGLLMMLLTTTTAWAGDVTVTSSTTTWTSGNTYNVTSDVTINASISVSGPVTLNLGAGTTLTVNQTINVSGSNNWLTITGNGTLIVNGPNGADGNESDWNEYGDGHGYDGGHGVNGNLIVNSGTVTISGGKGGEPVINSYSNGGDGGDGIHGSLILNGGTVSIIGGIGGNYNANYESNYVCGYGISENITLAGGTLVALAGNYRSSSYYSYDEYYSFDDYSSNVVIADGYMYKYIDDSYYNYPNMYLTGSLDYNQKENISHRPFTLKPVPFVGEGTEADPYKITSYNDLLKLRNDVNGGTSYDGKYFEQTADIDWPANTTWTSGIGTDADHRFGGHYDGYGNAIRHLTINGSSTNTGLFGFVRGASDGRGGYYSTTLKNIVLEDCNIDASSVSNSYAAGILAVTNFDNTVENCRVSGTIKGDKAAGGIIGCEDQGNVKNCFADVTVTASVQTGYNSSGQFQYCTVGKIIGYVVNFGSATVTGNYYHADGATDGTGNVVTAIGRTNSSTYSDGSRAAPLYTVSSTNLTAAATNATVTHAGTHYFAAGATATLATDGNHIISGTPTVSGTGASLGSVASDRKSMTVTVGTQDVTVSATLQPICGSCGANATWSLTQDGNGNYTRLTISGTGAMQDYDHDNNSVWRTTAPWGYGITSVTIGDGITTIGKFAFCGCQQLSSVTIGNSVTTIGDASINHCDALTELTLPASVASIGNGAFHNDVGLTRLNIQRTDGLVTLAENTIFNNCNALQAIVVPTLALAVQYQSATYWSTHAVKLRAPFGSQLFAVTTEGGTAAYVIANATDWNNLATAVNGGANGSGQTFRQTANITVSNFTPIGSSEANSFRGTYDGGSKSLTATCNAVSSNYVAPFGYLYGTTAAHASVKDLSVVTTITAAGYKHIAGLIAVHSGYVDVTNCNANVSISSTVGTPNPTDLYPAALVSQTGSGGTLTVTGCTATGTISTNGKYAGGLVGIVQGAATITDCVSSVTINSSTSGDGTHGGFVAVVNGSCTITGSVFNGKLLTTGETATGNCAGFIAWGNGSISNCLYAPAAIEGDEAEVVAGTGDYPSGTFYRGTAPSVSNCYYTRTLGTVQGKAPLAVTAGENVTVQVSPVGEAVEDGTYNVSGITAYAKSITRTVGQTTTFYYGQGDEVSLTLSHSDRTGYTFNSYTASAGTLSGTENPYTLTMPDDGDVTINATWTPITYSITYNLNGGELTTEKYSYTIESDDITLDEPTRKGYPFGGWYESSNFSGNAVTTIAHGSTGNKTFYAKWLVPYIDANGETQTCSNYTVLTNETNVNNLPGGWYVVDGTVSYNSQVYCSSGDLHLILCDGADMTINNDQRAIYVIHNLTIYAQSSGSSMGKLTATSTSNEGIYSAFGSITICGGKINATGGSIGIDAENDVTIHSGQVSASGDNGIYSSYGNITLGLRNANDFIYASSYYFYSSGTVKVADGQTLYYEEGGTKHFLAGTLDKGTIAGKTLKPAPSIILADNADNATTISDSDGETVTVTLQGRTLYQDGDWNTLCLPFNATKTGPLAGATIKEIDTETAYNGHKTGLEDGTLYLNFRDAESIVAGRPYIVKWDGDLVINSLDDWNTFASNVNNGTESYQGKLVKLAADISVSTMVGTADHPFCGTFDGAGHTLNVTITDEDNHGTAPFRYISDATIRNLKVTGTVTGNLHCAGLVGFAKGTNAIRQCEVAASVICSGSSHSHCGGIVGHGLSSATTITDCLFSGTISGTTTATGIIYGWGDGESTPAIVNCLANGTYTDCNGIDLLKKSEGTGDITNCYKTQAFGSQGTYTTATGSDLVTLLGDGWQVSGGNVVPKMNASIVKTIVNPVFAGVTIDASAPTAVTSDDGTVSFTGSYSPVSIAGEDRSILFLGASNTLYYPNAAMTIKACRAYFQLNNGLTAGDPTNGVRTFNLNFGDGGEASGITTTDFLRPDGSKRAELERTDYTDKAGAWFTLDGRKLDGKPTKAGLYIHGGRKVVVK